MNLGGVPGRPLDKVFGFLEQSRRPPAGGKYLRQVSNGKSVIQIIILCQIGCMLQKKRLRKLSVAQKHKVGLPGYIVYNNHTKHFNGKGYD